MRESDRKPASGTDEFAPLPARESNVSTTTAIELWAPPGDTTSWTVEAQSSAPGHLTVPGPEIASKTSLRHRSKPGLKKPNLKKPKKKLLIGALAVSVGLLPVIVVVATIIARSQGTEQRAIEAKKAEYILGEESIGSGNGGGTDNLRSGGNGGGLDPPPDPSNRVGRPPAGSVAHTVKITRNVSGSGIWGSWTETIRVTPDGRMVGLNSHLEIRGSGGLHTQDVDISS